MSWLSKSFSSLSQNKEKVLIIIVLLVLISKFKKILTFWKGYSSQNLESYRQYRQQSFIKYEQLANSKVPVQRQQYIISLTASALAKQIQNCSISCEEALLTYIKRASTIGSKLNLIADINFDEALKDAQDKDKQLQQIQSQQSQQQQSSGIQNNQDLQNLPPLFGVPISSKEQLKVQGLVTTAGYQSKFTTEKSTTDSSFMSLLRKNGAIPFMSTNVPQGLFGLEAHNQIWGQSQNPWNQHFTTGGSSGGECGVIAAQCSPLGICSDSLGSIRVPASFCGIRGFKPSGQRISKKGRVGISGKEGEAFKIVETSIGPVAKSVEDLVLVMQLVLGNFQQDESFTNQQQWNKKDFDSTDLKKLKIGYFASTKNCPITPSINNVMEEVVQTLKSEGCTLAPFQFEQLDELNRLTIQLFQYIGVYEAIQNNLLGERPLPYQHFHLMFINELYAYQKKLLIFYYKKRGQHRLASILQNSIKPSKEEFELMLQAKQKIIQDFQDYWKKEQFDVVLCPTFPSTALIHGSTPYFIHYMQLSCFQSAMDLPCGVVPIRTVKKEETEYIAVKKDIISEMMSYSAQISEGMPVGIQITTRQFEDEKCLKIMQQIDSLFKFNQMPKCDFLMEKDNNNNNEQQKKE